MLCVRRFFRRRALVGDEFPARKPRMKKESAEDE